MRSLDGIHQLRWWMVLIVVAIPLLILGLHRVAGIKKSTLGIFLGVVAIILLYLYLR